MVLRTDIKIVNCMVSSVYKTNQCLKKTLVDPNAVTEIPRNTAQAATINSVTPPEK